MVLYHTRVAIYVSVGTPDEGQDSQMAELRQYAVGMGWTVLEYRERRGRAGTRPALGQLMYRLRQSRIDVVLVKSAACFARSLAELAETVARLYRENIRFVAVPLRPSGSDRLIALELTAQAPVSDTRRSPLAT